MEEKKHIDYILEQKSYTLSDLEKSFNYIKDNKRALKGRLWMSIDGFNFFDRELKNDPNNSEIKKRLVIKANFLYKRLKNGDLDTINIDHSVKDRIEEIVNGNI